MKRKANRPDVGNFQESFAAYRKRKAIELAEQERNSSIAKTELLGKQQLLLSEMSNTLKFYKSELERAEKIIDVLLSLPGVAVK